MFRAAKVIASLHSDWEYATTADDSRTLGYLLEFHSEIRRLPPTAAAGMFLCHLMKRDYEFTSTYFPEVLINILNLPETRPEKISRHDANKLLAAATAALVGHQHPYLETFAENLCEPVA